MNGRHVWRYVKQKEENVRGRGVLVLQRGFSCIKSNVEEMK